MLSKAAKLANVLFGLIKLVYSEYNPLQLPEECQTIFVVFIFGKTEKRSKDYWFYCESGYARTDFHAAHTKCMILPISVVF